MSHAVENYDIQTAQFSKRNTLPSWKYANTYIFKTFAHDEDKNQKAFQFRIYG